MIPTTARLHTYQEPADDHNQRDEDTIAAENAAIFTDGKPRWIDPQGDHEVMGPGQTLLEAFGTVFGDAINTYNAGQKRADRKMTVDGYLQSVADSRRGRPVKSIKRANERARADGREEDVRKESGSRTHHELVISLGNVKPLRDPKTGKIVIDPATGQRIRPNYVEADVTRQILRDYIDGWAARNPNLYLFRCDYHADEWYRVQKGGQTITGLPGQWCQGEAHGHLDFIAFGEGYQRGPKRQASITKALEAMGYVDRWYDDGGEKKKVTAWEQWQDAERAVLADIARDYGYEIVPADDSREALSADEYAELADLKNDIQDAKAELTDTRIRTADLADREAAVTRREQALDKREAAIAPQEQELEAQRIRLGQAVADFNRQRQEAADLDDRLPRLRREAKAAEDRAAKADQDAENAATTAIQWGQHIEALQRQETALQARIAALRGQEDAAYRDAQERGYRDGYEAGQRDGVASPMGQIHAMQRREKEQAGELTDEQKRANARRDGIGMG